MDSDRLRRLEDLYHGAIEQPREKRDAWLTAACGAEIELRREVESLLARHEQGDGLLGREVWAAGAELVSVAGSVFSAGAKVGHFQIIGPLGKGAMGEVYKAFDTELKRMVAIKTLPAAFASDSDRLARFRREAEMLASLNHPNVAAIYGLANMEGVPSIVLELIDGPTLADRIASGRVALKEALHIAHQVAEALEAAHERGIIHRDLKPANIKLTSDGHVKVLDFGLAKILSPPSGPTLSEPRTKAHETTSGMIVGTPVYMSPEQARGKEIDKRADIWAWGCLLYELLSGRRTFDGPATADTLARIAADEPDWRQLPAETPPAVLALLRHALQKDPRQRLHDIADARIELDEIGKEPAAVMHRAPKRKVWQYLLIASLGIIAAVFAAAFYLRPAVKLPVTRLDIMTRGVPSSFALSADGRLFVYAVSVEGQTKLWLRRMESGTAQPIAGTEGAADPFWSPDGNSLGFVADGKLKTIDLRTGATRILHTFGSAPMAGAAWNRDGTILYGLAGQHPILRIPETGGESVPVTSQAETEGHRWPSFLPDQRHFVFYINAGTEGTGIYVASLDGTDRKRLKEGPTPRILKPIYAAGFLFFVNEGELTAQRFDTRNLTLTGKPIAIAQELDPIGQPGGRAPFDVSSKGTIVYRSNSGNNMSRLLWVDRSGMQIRAAGPDGLRIINPELSRDDSSIAVIRDYQEVPAIWLLDTVRPVLNRFTTDASAMAVWSPDGKSMAFNSGGEIHRKATTAEGKDEVLISLDRQPRQAMPSDWSLDDRYLLYTAPNPSPAAGVALWFAPLSDMKQSRLLVTSGTNVRMGQFSPDVQWVAYTAEEGGRPEIFIQSFPEASRKIPISTNGGVQPRWRRDGKELFYIAPDEKLMSVSIDISADGRYLVPGAPLPLFQTHILNGFSIPQYTRHQYAVTRDGKRFLVNMAVETTTMTIVLNWAPESKP